MPVDEALKMLGKMALDLSMAELQIDFLIQLYVGEDAGRPVLLQVRNKDTLLGSLVQHLAKDEELRVRLLNALSAYRSAMENRNILVHSYSVEETSNGKLSFERSNKKSADVSVNITEARKDEIEKIASFAHHVQSQLVLLFLYQAQESGYRVLAGSTQLGLPHELPSPTMLKNVDTPTVKAALSDLKKR